jgi:hypothetical protein
MVALGGPQEASYTPDVFGETPNARWEVG